MLLCTFLVQTLIAAAALAEPLSRLHDGRRVSRRAVDIDPPRIYPAESVVAAGKTEAPARVLSDTLAGVSIPSSNGTYNLVAAHVELPIIRPPPDGAPVSGAYPWVGIGGIGCGVATFQVGLRLIAAAGFSDYAAWYRWYPGPLILFEGITLRPGDNLHFILLTSNDGNSGYAAVINDSTGEGDFAHITGPTLCQRNVGWMVERLSADGTLLPLPDFGNLNYTTAVAGEVSGGSVGPDSPGAVVYDVVQNGTVVTKTVPGFLNVDIRYNP